MICYSVFFIIFGLIIDSPKEVLYGMKNILFQSNILLTDYIELGGIGASFVNSGLLTLMCILMLVGVGVKPNGATIAVLWLIPGFSLFGKNILNVWPIILGVFLYSKYQKEPFLNYILIALFGTTLSPAVSELIFTGIFPVWISIIIGIMVSVFMGFILPPVASYCIKLHEGYNLYNIGFAAGLLATMLMSIFRAFNIDFEDRLLWSTGNNTLFAVLLLSIFSSLIILGYILNNKSFKNLGHILDQPGRLVTDFYLINGKGATYINMGLLGIVFTILILVIGGSLNGPTIGGIFTIVGFGSFGKHFKNTIPVAIGALLCSLINIWEINSPGMLLAILFSTTLAPISGHFGWPFGVLAGFLHVCVVKNMGYLHGGMNLYNNGFAGGTVAIILVPIITAFKENLHSGVDDYRKIRLFKKIIKSKNIQTVKK
jgi:hypothetical protein